MAAPTLAATARPTPSTPTSTWAITRRWHTRTYAGRRRATTLTAVAHKRSYPLAPRLPLYSGDRVGRKLSMLCLVCDNFDAPAHHLPKKAPALRPTQPIRPGALPMQAANEQLSPDDQALSEAAAALDAGNGARALEICKALAEQGNATAQYNLGVLYERAAGLTPDYSQAVHWYTLAAEQNNAMAQYNLGVMYDLGRGVPQDNEKALLWLGRAASNGNASAQTNLGVMYDNGQGVEQNLEKAAQLFQLAAVQGNAVAQCNLASMYFYGVGVEQNFEQALTLYVQSAEQGNAAAQAKVNEIIAAIDAETK